MSDNTFKPTRGRADSRIVLTEHATRNVKYYAIAQHELRSISAFNSWGTACFSICTFFLSIAIGIWSNIFAAGNPSELTKEYGQKIELVCAIISGIAFVAGCYAHHVRRSFVTQLRADSGDDVRHWWERAWNHKTASSPIPPARS
jgi:hypothetical protein